MLVEDQSEVIAFLSDVAAYAGRGLAGTVARIDTHISHVFLVGDRVFKLKRAVKFPYLDFSSEPKRRAAAAAELTLNRRTAPELYLGLVVVARAADGGLALTDGGSTAAVDWLVEMRRFEQADVLDRMALDGRLSPALMVSVAEAVASFHAEAKVRRDLGGSDGLRHATEGIRGAFAESPEGLFEPAAVAALLAASAAAIERHAGLLDARRADGFVRHCHGDLHLRNIALVADRPVLFDCIEFSEEIATVDVLYDLAFLLMDLWHRGLRAHANAAFNRYLEITSDRGGLAALPLFLGSRAAIRAHVTATTAGGTEDAGARKRLGADAREYLKLARAFLAPPAPTLVAVGGLSGTGKTTLARGLAPDLPPAPGALVLRSDVIRKEIAGVDPLTRLGDDGYTAEMTEATYDAIDERARAALAAGHSVVADAVNARPEDRAALEAIAADAGTAFAGVWLEAPLKVLEARVSARSGDASDADAAIVRAAIDWDTGPIAWPRIEASGSPDDVLARARAALGEAGA